MNLEVQVEMNKSNKKKKTNKQIDAIVYCNCDGKSGDESGAK